MHDLIASPFLGDYLVLRSGSGSGTVALCRRGISEAEFYREALRRAISPHRPKPAVALFASGTDPGTSNLASRVDELLAEGFGER